MRLWMNSECAFEQASEEVDEGRERIDQAGFNLGIKVVVKTSVRRHANRKVSDCIRSFCAVTFGPNILPSLFPE